MGDAYEAWNQALIQEYFPPGGRGRLAYLPVDDDELAAMAEPYGLCSPDEATNHLVAAVKNELATKSGSFSRFSVWVGGWRRVRETPPYIAGLALCVLAASRMEQDAEARVASHNYYTQLNRILGRPDRAGAPPGFDTLGAAWQDLARWLDDDCGGDRGSSTIRTSDRTGRHIGYPLSQTLLRACDRRRLPDFFSVAGLAPGTDISPDRLFVLLRAWAAQPSCGFTARARRAISAAEDVDREEIAETVARELSAWDGLLRDARGRKRASIHLLVIQRARGTVVRLIAERPAGFPGAGWTYEGSGELADLQPHVSSDYWFQPFSAEITRRIMDHGLRLVSGTFALTLDPAPAIPCRQAAVEIGGYLSQPEATLWEPHLAIVRRDLAEDLQRSLGPYCEGSVSLHPSETNLPGGWVITRPFRFERIPESLPSDFARLTPRLVATTSLEGGLRVGPRIYLTGGEPDARIASDTDPEMLVELDGVAQRLQGGALTLPLSEMGLPAGHHSLKVDVTRMFDSVETFGDVMPHGAGELGHLFERHKDYHPETEGAVAVPADPPPGHIALSGAALRGDRDARLLTAQRPLLFRGGGREYFVIGARTGEVAKPVSMDAPGWLELSGLGAFFQFVEISAAFEPAWFLYESSTGERLVKLIELKPPQPSEPRGDWERLILRWQTAAVEDDDHRPAWRQYIAAAGGES